MHVAVTYRWADSGEAVRRQKEREREINDEAPVNNESPNHSGTCGEGVNTCARPFLKGFTCPSDNTEVSGTKRFDRLKDDFPTDWAI